MNQKSYQRLIPLVLPLLLGACEEREEVPAPQAPSTIPDPAAPATPTPPSTPPPGQ